MRKLSRYHIGLYLSDSQYADDLDQCFAKWSICALYYRVGFLIPVYHMPCGRSTSVRVLATSECLNFISLEDIRYGEKTEIYYYYLLSRYIYITNRSSFLLRYFKKLDIFIKLLNI